jgi:hypothetical protein
VPRPAASRPDPSGIENCGYACKGFNTRCPNTIDDRHHVLGVSDGPRLDTRCADGRIRSAEPAAYATLTVKQKEETYAS